MLETLFRHLDMVRLTATTAAVLMIAGCTGLIDDGDGGDAKAQARVAWMKKAQPVIRDNCLSCHNGTQAGIGFVEGADPAAQREALLAYEPAVVNLEAPQSSRLLTKGQHNGPALLANQASALLDWIQLEKTANTDGGGGVTTLQTARFRPQICTGGLPGEATCPVNDVALDDLAPGLGIPGGKLRFVAQALGSGLYVNNLKLLPGPNGAYIEHPLFVSYPANGEPMPDTIDRFFNVKMNLMAGVPADDPSTQIAGGTAAFVGFVATDEIAIHFRKAEAYIPEGGPGPGPEGGCKVPDSFEQNARTPLNNNCGSCHRGQNQNATSALDMSGVDQPNAGNACNQVRLRVNLVDPNQSGIYLATVPGNTNHPFAFPNQGAHDAFKNAVNVWINAEKVAP